MINEVKLFMELTGQHIPESPTIPTQAIQQLRFGLIDEENKELADAAVVGDIIEVADALCDILYVAFGACLAYGFSAELMQELFAEVQASNMSKVCQTITEAERTHDMYIKAGIPVQINSVKGLYTVTRLSDNKVLKSINWKSPDIENILIKHGII